MISCYPHDVIKSAHFQSVGPICANKKLTVDATIRNTKIVYFHSVRPLSVDTMKRKDSHTEPIAVTFAFAPQVGDLEATITLSYSAEGPSILSCTTRFNFDAECVGGEWHMMMFLRDGVILHGVDVSTHIIYHVVTYRPSRPPAMSMVAPVLKGRRRPSNPKAKSSKVLAAASDSDDDASARPVSSPKKKKKKKKRDLSPVSDDFEDEGADEREAAADAAFRKKVARREKAAAAKSKAKAEARALERAMKREEEAREKTVAEQQRAVSDDDDTSQPNTPVPDPDYATGEEEEEEEEPEEEEEEEDEEPEEEEEDASTPVDKDRDTELMPPPADVERVVTPGADEDCEDEDEEVPLSSQRPVVGGKKLIGEKKMVLYNLFCTDVANHTEAQVNRMLVMFTNWLEEAPVKLDMEFSDCFMGRADEAGICKPSSRWQTTWECYQTIFELGDALRMRPDEIASAVAASLIDYKMGGPDGNAAAFEAEVAAIGQPGHPKDDGEYMQSVMPTFCEKFKEKTGRGVKTLPSFRTVCGIITLGKLLKP
jgi:hypothetical protein